MHVNELASRLAICIGEQNSTCGTRVAILGDTLASCRRVTLISVDEHLSSLALSKALPPRFLGKDEIEE
jgi:hypothetical protein